MIRSFHYAAQVALAERDEFEREAVTPLADAWEARNRDAFLGGYAEVEVIATGSLWSVTPSAGRRSYRDPAAASGLDPFAVGRSSYGFVQLDALGDQRLPAGWRMRVSGSARWELHEDSVENATSLYFSLDVRRLF